MTPSPTKELMSATPTISRRPREEFAEKVSECCPELTADI